MTTTQSLFHRMSNTGQTTDNGAKTLATSTSKLLDFYYMSGSSRNIPEDQIRTAFDLSLKEDFEKTIRVLFYTRDCRGGRGERRIFEICLKHLAGEFFRINKENKFEENLNSFYSIIPEFGTWKDLLKIFPAKEVAPVFIKALEDKDKMGLAAKWLPRQSYKENGEIVTEIRRLMKLSAKEYRKMLVEKTNVVEQAMCAKKFDIIKFDSVPSKAFNIYKKSFQKQAPEQFQAFMESLVKGEVKVNAKQLFPHELFQSFVKGDRKDLIQQQWNNLKDFNIPENKKFITVIDTSGSMGTKIGNTNLCPRDVAFALGVYFSERISGSFKDKIITYSNIARFIELGGTVTDKFTTLLRNSIVQNTNLQSVFNLILNSATNNGKGPRVSEEEMPTTILIISDMQFDQNSYNDTTHKMIVKEYEKYGYKMPEVIYWNVNAKAGDVPVKCKAPNVALASGYMPSDIKGIIESESLKPYDVMVQTIMDERYDLPIKALGL